jgi:hypothetical protein
VVVVELVVEEFRASDKMEGHECPEYVDPYPPLLLIDRKSDNSSSVSLVRGLRCLVRKEIFWT